MDGQSIARQRISREAEERTGFLNLGQLGLRELPKELFTLKHLHRLNLGAFYHDEAQKWHDSASSMASNAIEAELKQLTELDELQYLSLVGSDVANVTTLGTIRSLRSLDCSHTRVSDLSPLQALQSLQSLHCSYTQVSDLSPLQALQSLQSLHCSHTRVSDLSPLQALPSLQSLGCSSTQVSDLSPLQALQSLQSFHCSSTQVSDLSPLQALQSLQSLGCSSTQVSDLSPLQALQSLQSLDCSSTQVSDLSPLQALQSLRSLYCSFTQVSDLSPLQALQSLQSLECSHIQVSDLSPLQALQSLQSLVCSSTQVSDLSPLQALQSLQSLDCSSTQVSDLSPLQALQSLQSLACSSPQVSDLSPLQALQNLQSLYCSYTQVSDLSPLQALQSLQSLHCSSTQVSDLSPLQALQSLQSLDCSSTQVSDLSLLQALQSLQSLHCSSTQVSDLSPLQALQSLRSLDCSSTQVSDLSPLQALQSLQSLYCSSTQASDLSPLQALQSLRSLVCSHTQVNDLSPLQALQSLRSLVCSHTQVNDLSPLQALQSLQSLVCSHTRVNDLSPLQALQSLHSLVCSSTQVSDLSPLQVLQSLQSLDCSSTQVSDLSPLQALRDLQSLYCSYTQVSDLSPLQALQSLQSLHCSSTQVSDLSPLHALQSLQSLVCSRCHLSFVPEGFWQKPSLTGVFLYETRLTNIPVEVLSQDESDDCLDSLRAHLGDLSGGQEVVPDVKLLVLGNGRVGKTQMCRRLRGEDYDESVDSTHGVLVTSAKIAGPADADTIRLQIWDFGGQDIYLGTHALFLRSRAIFPLVWIPEAEKATEHRHGGYLFRNRPLAYWLDYVRHFGGAACPVLIVQARCDRPEDEQVRPPVSDDALGAFSFRKLLHYSACLDRGRAALDESVLDAARWLQEHQGIPEIGVGRSRVKRRLEAMRDEDAARPLSERQYRTISHEYFQQLCAEAGGITQPEHLLSYLHNAGTIFYRHGLFANQIILDQGWALESIYAIFHRERSYRKLQRQKGRFTRSDLAEWLWDEAGHGVAEQDLFLSMMQSCGICFIYRKASPRQEIEAEYIAPDLLPERPEIELAQKWDATLPIETAEFTYSLLPPGLMRGIISRIGGDAGLAADYWRDGLYVYETGTGSRARIEQETTVGWQGRIHVQTQRGQAGVLLDRMKTIIEEEQRRAGTVPTEATMTLGRPATTARKEAIVREEPEIKPPLKFSQEPKPQPEYFVSYAWGDNTPEGHAREIIVDQLCDAAKKRGNEILRDRNVLDLGESVSKFMQRIGRGDRVFVVLSEKYLKSPYCMYELFEVWKNCRQEDREFLNRIRIYTLPGTDIWSPLDRAIWAKYWKEQSRKIEVILKEHSDILGDKDYHQYRLMKEFSHHISDILWTVADILQPRSFEELEKYGFGDAPAADRNDEV